VYYMKAISLNDTYADAYLGAGGIYYEKGDYDSEVKYYEKAVELAPDDYDAVSTLGSAYEDTGRYGEAIKMFRKTIELKPDDKDSMYTLGVLSILTGDIQTARELLPPLMKLNRGLGTELGALTEIAATSETFNKLVRRPSRRSGDGTEN
jgi:tetratricopeptide (TPR) repeat protein